MALIRKAANAYKTIAILALWLGSSAATNAPDYPAAARALEKQIEQSYAYREKLPGGMLPSSVRLDAKRAAVRDGDSLLRYAEDRIASLADHHATTSSSFKDSWALVPTYADLWMVKREDRFVVDAIREGSPAALAGILPGQLLVAVNDIATDLAVKAFWDELGLDVTPRRAEFAARVLAAGRRDRDRQLSIADGTGRLRVVTLPSLYSVVVEQQGPLSVSTNRQRTLIRFNNSLGDSATIVAFDEAMVRVPPGNQVVLDLRDTPSGGNTTIARAIMGWFTDKPRGYQVHNSPAEERETGIARQWIEQVLPRPRKYRARLPTIWVGRWTGSMGEGLAIGFAAMGADIRGSPMAGLNGAVEDFELGNSGMSVALPTERLMTTKYQPREDFTPRPMH